MKCQNVAGLDQVVLLTLQELLHYPVSRKQQIILYLSITKSFPGKKHIRLKLTLKLQEFIKHVTSPYNIHKLSNKKEMRILKLFRQKLLS